MKYPRQYANTTRRSHHASECIQCGQCETNCPFGVVIIEQMEKAAEKFGY